MQKVVEVISLHCLNREPRPGAADNLWVAEVLLEVPPQLAKDGRMSIRRTVQFTAKDELEAFTNLLKEGV